MNTKENIEKLFELKGQCLGFPSFSLAEGGMSLSRLLIRNDKGIFPVICFNNVAQFATKIQKNNEIVVTGKLKEYDFDDLYNINQKIKIIMAVAISTDNDTSEELDVELSEKIWDRLKSSYKFFDILIYEKFHSEYKLCYQ